MKSAKNQYNPDYAVPPGWVLKERLDIWGLSSAEFASRCGYAPDVISEIIECRGRIDQNLASVLGRETGLDESIWLGMENAYRNKLNELGRNAELSEWARKFPVQELVNRGVLSKQSLDADEVARLLSFFDVWSVGTFQDKCITATADYRPSPGFKRHPQALAVWLRLGEIEAERAECADYDKAAFMQALTRIRALTPKDSSQVFSEAKNLCRQSGVTLCFTKPLPGLELSGAAWWYTAQNPVIQLCARHLKDDHLWFSLFQKAAHILLHDKGLVFIDAIRAKSASDDAAECQAELDADIWAQDFLIPRAQWDEFTDSFRGNAAEVRRFAEQQGIAPGIIVGRLQRAGRIPWGSRMNNLKRKLEWRDSPAHPRQD